MFGPAKLHMKSIVHGSRLYISTTIMARPVHINTEESHPKRENKQEKKGQNIQKTKSRTRYPSTKANNKQQTTNSKQNQSLPDTRPIPHSNRPLIKIQRKIRLHSRPTKVHIVTTTFRRRIRGLKIVLDVCFGLDCCIEGTGHFEDVKDYDLGECEGLLGDAGRCACARWGGYRRGSWGWGCCSRW